MNNPKLKINCDIGERDINHPIDIELFKFIDIANIACGGHSGDKKSIAFYLNLCEKHSVIPCLHISYPDKKNFGRKSMNISWQELEKSLNQQRNKISLCKIVKFHGSLYHEVCHNPQITDKIIDWLERSKIEEIIILSDCHLSKKLPSTIKAIPEFFLDRRYIHQNNTLQLMSRKFKEACINDLNEAKEQAILLIQEGRVKAKLKNSWQIFSIKAKTLSIHSDSLIALELVQFISSYLQINKV